jgi:hypothetical protein
MTRFISPPSRLGILALSLCLSGSLLAAGTSPSWAKEKPKKEATPQKVERSDRKSTRTLLKEAPPVLDEQARKSLMEAAGKLDAGTRATLIKLSDAVHLEDKAIHNELRDDEELAVTDIGMLWEAAVERSGTIRYAIEKLSRRDATGKPVEADSFSKRMVSSLVHLGGVAGSMWTQSPAGMIGSNMVQDLMSGSPDESVLARVTDADMVILAKEVEALQSNLLELYYNYRHAQERLALARESQATIGKYYTHATAEGSNTDESLQPLVQSIYDSARQDEQNAQQTYNSARTALALLVGPEAVAVLEQDGKYKKANTTAGLP